MADTLADYLARSQARRNLIAHFFETLATAQTHRRERDDFVDSDVDPYGHEVGWVVYEREQMHAAVNAELAKRGLGPAPLDEILYIERQAQGHVDYVKKWAIGCADLVLTKEKANA